MGLDIFVPSLNEEEACRFVTDEYPNICTCTCDDDPDPTPAPIPDPTRAPTPNPTLAPTKAPIATSTLRCGCDKCTEVVWNTLVVNVGGEFSCGDRITFMEESDEATLISVGITTGPYDEAGACRYVNDEFPTICTCTCDDDDDDEQPTKAPTGNPTSPQPTFEPTRFDDVDVSSEPTTSPTISCVNSDTVVFADKKGNDKKCSWVKGNKKKIRKKCKKKDKNGVRVSDACPKTCGKKVGVGKCKFLFNA